jgi:hypothetical protein
MDQIITLENSKLKWLSLTNNCGQISWWDICARPSATNNQITQDMCPSMVNYTTNVPCSINEK